MTKAFGSKFAGKMSIAWFRGGAWSPHALQATQPLALHPSAHVLHYSSSCFEGLKAYRQDDGNIKIFRLDRHVARMQASARLLCLPAPEAAQLEAMIVSVVDACRESIPPFPGALYLRPVLIGTENNIGAAATGSTEACLYVLGSPVGDYFAGGQRPLSLLIEEYHARTTLDFGVAKTGANYAAGLRHIMLARKTYGVDQVLFCPGGHVQETGAANFILLNDDAVVTKALDTTILHGVTRASLLQLAADLGYDVSEREIEVTDVLGWIKNGEAALSGTAAVLAGVGTLIRDGETFRVGDGGVGRNTVRLRAALNDIQRGAAPDPHGWLRAV